MASTTGAADDWRELYREMNQVSDRLRLDQLEFSEVMIIHRMYIKLSELDLGHLEGAEKVKHLYVFADVVELDAAEDPNTPVDLRLPGSMSVVLLCRVWHVSRRLVVGVNSPQYGLPVFSARPVRVQLHHARWHLNLLTNSMHRIDPQTLQELSGPFLCVYADVLRTSLHPPVGHSNWDPALAFPPLSVLRRLEVLPYFDPSTPRQGLVTAPWNTDPQWVNQLLAAFIFDNLDAMTEILSLPAGASVILDRDRPTIELMAGQTSGYSDRNMSAPAFSILRDGAETLIDCLTDPNFLPAMQTSMLIVELVEVGRPSAAIIEVVHKHLEWLNNLLLQVIEAKKGKDVEDYIELSYRAQYVLKNVGRIDRFVVPQLQYDTYSLLINRMAQVAESYDQALRQFRIFIEQTQQNKILGAFLLEQNRAFADKEKDMDIFYSELIAQRQIELHNTLQKMEHLGLQMETQSADMEQAQADMEAGLRRFQNEQVARAVFRVLGAIAAVSLAFLTGGATAGAAVGAAKSAVTAAGAAARGLQQVLDILEGLQAVMEVVGMIKELFSSLKDVGQAVELPEMPEMPLESDWHIFVNEVELVAEQMPTEVSEVAAWKTKCKNVAVLGREMISLATYISQLQYDIQMQEMLQEIARKQADRLSGIQLSMANPTGYTEMMMQMDMRTTRLLVALIKVVHIQNAALMYQYLSEPIPVSAWPVNMDAVWRILVQHEQSAIQGLLRLGPASDIVRTFVVDNIPVSLLLEGDDYEFDIPVEDNITFPLSLSRVRIHHLEMKFAQGGGGGQTQAHMPSTDTGSVYILLQSSRTFHDRNERALVHYEAATSLDYHYAYKLETGETKVSNQPSAEFRKTFMRTTPFTNWRLRLSASAEENKGLAFPTATSVDATTRIAVTFYISAVRQVSF